MAVDHDEEKTMGNDTDQNEMLVNMLEPVLHNGVKYRGKELPVPRALGEHFCTMGWAEDASGEVATQPRDVHRKAVLSPDNVKLMNGVGEA
ncbi:MAG: hypothetical protein Tp1111SUR522732_26 [Prokaryotic dsDNA virus sp.]|uniref:hypothetical protein n=1 Tax=Methylophaga sp. UBA2689 TaxID=1946878 RepID=UPI00118D09AE|nr:hypothetical protein [Methylophaga sp. UBA2689]QDP47088.1 MAG: hypothetical protein Tp1111SUR522732_26 [Prokaryotic dsDNA virus sp.]|tara:strand:- start:131 stop:403 length:273 start_codon:yes stop_codon:yes gene_type:complete